MDKETDVCIECEREWKHHEILEYLPSSTIKDNSNHLSLDQQQELQNFLEQHQSAFAKDLSQLGKTNLVQHEIPLESNTPIRQRAYHTAPIEQQFIKEEVENMLKQGLIQPSESPWASPVVLVKKKNRKTRFCVDYRKLNSITRRDGYPLPRIDELLDSFGKAKYFSTLDLASRY